MRRARTDAIQESDLADEDREPGPGPDDDEITDDSDEDPDDEPIEGQSLR